MREARWGFIGTKRSPLVPPLRQVLEYYMMQCICRPRCFKNRLHDTACCQTGLTTGCIVYTARCQTGCATLFDNRLNEQWLFVQHGCQTGCQAGLTTGWMFVYTIQPVVKSVVQPD